MHFDGAWQVSVERAGDSLNAIWAFPDGEAFAAGGSIILHREPD
jgi:hypothetical protein